MSTSSLSEEDKADLCEGGVQLNSDELTQQFETLDTTWFHVEWTEKGDDIVYHFWPPGEDGVFLPGFEIHLEAAFKAVLPSDQEVRADYTSLREATVQHIHGSGMVPKKDVHKEIVTPRETYYVRVIEGLKNPLSDVFLKGRVFTKLESEIREHI